MQLFIIIKNIYCLQFHPEVTHTKNGEIIIKNFIYEVCRCKKKWTTTNIIKDIISTLQTQVGKKKVILALSGGVDSTVVAALLNKALPKQLTCVFIDTGLMRKDEVKEVQDNISIKLGINLVTVNAKSIFLKNSKSFKPRKKRERLSERLLLEYLNHTQKLTNIEYLAQGTIYPDVIESSSKDSKSDVIKSHHNVGGLPKSMQFKLVEPIKSLFKDEVRRIGRALKIPKNLIERHPFPGPGLAVRIIGGNIRRKSKHSSRS